MCRSSVGIPDSARLQESVPNVYARSLTRPTSIMSPAAVQSLERVLRGSLRRLGERALHRRRVGVEHVAALGQQRGGLVAALGLTQTVQFAPISA